jgi:chromosome segregation ATPase
MAARMITYENVASVCDELARAGERPTTLNIHKKLGRGSYSTVKKHIDAWLESDSAKEAEASRLPTVVELPNDFVADCDVFLKKIYKTAEAQSAAKIEQVRAERNLAVAAAETQAKEAIDYADQLAEEKAFIEEQLESERGKVHALESNLKSAETSINVSADRLSDAIDNNKELKALAEKTEALAANMVKQVAKLEQELALARQENGALAEKLSQSQNEAESAKALSERLSSDGADFSKQIALLEQKNELLEKSLGDIKSAHEKAVSQLIQAHDKTLKVQADALADAQKQRDAIQLKIDGC